MIGTHDIWSSIIIGGILCFFAFWTVCLLRSVLVRDLSSPPCFCAFLVFLRMCFWGDFFNWFCFCVIILLFPRSEYDFYGCFQFFQYQCVIATIFERIGSCQLVACLTLHHGGPIVFYGCRTGYFWFVSFQILIFPSLLLLVHCDNLLILFYMNMSYWRFSSHQILFQIHFLDHNFNILSLFSSSPASCPVSFGNLNFMFRAAHATPWVVCISIDTHFSLLTFCHSLFFTIQLTVRVHSESQERVSSSSILLLN